MRARWMPWGPAAVAALSIAAALAVAWPAGAQAPPPVAPDTVPSSAWLGLLPDGEVKRRFILDCTGCHTLHRGIARTGGRARNEEEWRVAAERMLSFAGAATSFPVISADHDPAATARWLAAHLRAAPAPAPRPPLPAGASFTEYPFPVPEDLPHDVAVAPGGRVVVTGMFTHRMLVLDPASGTWTPEAIPVPGANPRAVEVDAAGDWYVLLGGPQALARRQAASGAWTTWDLGVYPHSLAIDRGGRVWFNGHFTREPPLVGVVDPGAGTVRTHGAPIDAGRARGGGPIPYGLRIAPDGRVWGTELAGDRLVGLDPATGRFHTFELPVRASGPRRPDFDALGVLWVPEYANNRLGRFDPADGSYRAYELPLPDALPYVVRVDRRRDRVWIGTGGADALLAFDPVAERFTVYPLPRVGSLVRHLDVDEASGEVWAACGQSPGVATSVVRLRVAEPAPAG